MPNLSTLKHLFTVALFAVIAQAPVAHATLLSLQPAAVFAANGESVSLDLVVSDLGNFGPDSLGAFDVSVGYDPTALSFTGFSLNNLLGDLGLAEALDISSGDIGGAVNVAEVSLLSAGGLDALQPGEFILASLSFDVLNLAVGATTQLSIMRGALLAAADGSSLPLSDALSASITGRASVPTAGTLWLLLGGMLSWRLSRRLHKPGY